MSAYMDDGVFVLLIVVFKGIPWTTYFITNPKPFFDISVLQHTV